MFAVSIDRTTYQQIAYTAETREEAIAYMNGLIRRCPDSILRLWECVEVEVPFETIDMTTITEEVVYR